MDNGRIKVHQLYGPSIQQTLTEWVQHVLYLSLDTSMLWRKYCIIHLSIVYRDRAIPWVWKVIVHQSSTVAFNIYKDLLNKAAQLLLPFDYRVVFLADRGFADTDLRTHLNKLDWLWHIRLKGNFKIYWHDCQPCETGRITSAAEQAIFWHNDFITAERFGPVHIAIARRPQSKEF